MSSDTEIWHLKLFRQRQQMGLEIRRKILSGHERWTLARLQAATSDEKKNEGDERGSNRSQADILQVSIHVRDLAYNQ
jgi:hypothetical protein